jgi:2,5-diamino-6-(ribosylamino)-4(3H)-pyrimidinone 5'-phosphate reductase
VRPFIHLNFAFDQQGRHCGAGGEPLAISCTTDWRRVHALREQYDAVAVGGRTWRLDRPRLNVRADRLGRPPNRQPARVAFLGGHRYEPGALTPPTFVIARSPTELPGSTVIRAPGRGLEQPLGELWRMGVRSMLVEGGPTLLGSFLVQNCFDRMTVFVRGASYLSAVAHARLTLPGLPWDLQVESLGDGLILGFVRPNGLGCSVLAAREAE